MMQWGIKWVKLGPSGSKWVPRDLIGPKIGQNGPNENSILEI